MDAIDNAAKGTTRICADDIGCALLSLESLKLLYPIFVVAADVAGLRLKPPKCIIVPTSVPFSADVAAHIRQWLEANIPL